MYTYATGQLCCIFPTNFATSVHGKLALYCIAKQAKQVFVLEFSVIGISFIINCWIRVFEKNYVSPKTSQSKCCTVRKT
jgi:hypothetical protein